MNAMHDIEDSLGISPETAEVSSLSVRMQRAYVLDYILKDRRWKFDLDVGTFCTYRLGAVRSLADFLIRSGMTNGFSHIRRGDVSADTRGVWVGSSLTFTESEGEARRCCLRLHVEEAVKVWRKNDAEDKRYFVFCK